MVKITVIGAGNSGLAMACHLSIEGYKVTLWNRTKKNIKKIKNTNKIKISGIYNEEVNIYKVTSDLEEAIDESEVIMITTPANSHNYLAKEIGKVIKSGKIIILNPGRTFGVICFKKEFNKVNKNIDIIVAETQTIIYTARKLSPNHVNLICFKSNVLLASDVPSKYYFFKLPECYTKYIKLVDSLIETSIGNVGMVLHTAPMLLNAGWIENEKFTFNYYFDGITPSIGALLEKIDQERVEVSRKLGHPVDSTKKWIENVYNVQGINLYESLQNNTVYQTILAPTTLNHRYILEDITCGLVPLEFLGKELNVDVKNISLIINLAESLMDIDFRLMGRKISLSDFKKFI